MKAIMKGKKLFLMLAVALACSGLAWLGASVAQPNVTVVAAPSIPGRYILSCLMDLAISGIQPCMSGNQIPVGTELVLKAHVQDSFGTAATGGAVIFQDCSLRGIPAPSAACISGSGAWSHVITLFLVQTEMPRWTMDLFPPLTRQ
jgi:hypothetical protein